MKIRQLVITFLLAGFVAALYASSCVEVCNQQLKADVAACNNPQKENPRELDQCLKTARANFDACKTACGR
jgi:hypothetical protein